MMTLKSLLSARHLNKNPSLTAACGTQSEQHTSMCITG